jgi:CDP-glucose 4,6-dehydratase
VSFRNIFFEAYSGKKVLVTGHTGFKGSWLALWLQELGAEVCGYSLYLPSNPCNFQAVGLEKRIDHHQGDVRDLDHLDKVFIQFKPDIVFHLAAQPIVRISYDQPKLTFDTNLGGTVNIMEMIKKHSCVKAAVIITSDKCYENVGWDQRYSEDDRLGGQDPYSASKACAEIAVSSYMRSYFNSKDSAKVATVRAGNVIGGGDWAKDRIIPDCIKSWSNNDPVVVRNPQATRPWQHVLEPLSGYLWLGAKLLAGDEKVASEAFNFGPESDIIKTVEQVVTGLIKYWPRAGWKDTSTKSSKHEAALLQLSCVKAASYLDWHPALDFEGMMKMTSDWYKNYYQKNDSYDFCCKQIKDYVDRAKDRGIAWAKK